LDGPIPGGVYAWGTDQRIEDFADVEVAQSELLMWNANESRMWRPITPTKFEAAQVGNLRRYFPMRARWRLKDGREFILESIDTATILREYFATHPAIKAQWERENRSLAFGDASPELVHDIKGDGLRLRWVLRINRTPIEQRRTNPWTVEREVYPITVIKGTPVSGLDFKTLYELRK
jgi:hypothetical protein